MRIEHVHFYVKDAKQWRDWFINCLGFQEENSVDSIVRLNTISSIDTINSISATNSDDTLTEVVTSGSARFLLSSPLKPTSPVAQYLNYHPSGVADVAIAVENLEIIINRAVNYGTKILRPIQYEYNHNPPIKWAKISPWGELNNSLSHTLIEQTESLYKETLRNGNKETEGFAIDHVVLNVPMGNLYNTVSWYEKIFGFYPQQVFNIKTENSGLYSQVMISANGEVKLPINQPASSNSQIQEFIDLNKGSGIQHIALASNNLVDTVTQLRGKGLPLLSASLNYYPSLIKRPGFPLSENELKAIVQQEILVDWQLIDRRQNGEIPLLLQIFTKPIFEEPTFFFEFIERRFQAKGFGEGNFRALFEAIEAEQNKRGTLKT
jgi:4-hydroxyphenylpyruvate dioxygenase